MAIVHTMSNSSADTALSFMVAILDTLTACAQLKTFFYESELKNDCGQSPVPRSLTWAITMY